MTNVPIKAAGVPSIEDILDSWAEERHITSRRPEAIYVSQPITTGRRFVSWYADTGHALDASSSEYSLRHRAEVILPNLQHARRFIEVLRWRHGGVIIDPGALDVPGWTQDEYNTFWRRVVQTFVRRMILLDGWEFSTGCCLEFETAQDLGIECLDEDLVAISALEGARKIRAAEAALDSIGLPNSVRTEIADRIAAASIVVASNGAPLKDTVLDRIAHTDNIAQFVSFGPGAAPEQRYLRVIGKDPSFHYSSVEEAIAALLERSPSRRVNVRSFCPDRIDGNPFLKGFAQATEAAEKVKGLARQGLYTIVNELIDESDGGVSGVLHRGWMEFAPDATPRCVDDTEKHTCDVSSDLGLRMLTRVYGFSPDLEGRAGSRVEFSIHPRPCGWRRMRTVIWQLDQRPGARIVGNTVWPNDFSRMLGDKAFGLLLADSLGMHVPFTCVFTRRLFPFRFGRSVGSTTTRIRTCPAEKVPGYFPSTDHWVDPRAVLENPWILGDRPHTFEHGDPVLASVVAQESILAQWSGKAAWNSEANRLQVEGVRGGGEAFMLGRKGAASIPPSVHELIEQEWRKARSTIGVVDMEWVFDGETVWTVQLGLRTRALVTPTHGQEGWQLFEVPPGTLEDFRVLIARIRNTGAGVKVIGNVGALSHFGDIAEIAGVAAAFLGKTSPPTSSSRPPSPTG